MRVLIVEDDVLTADNLDFLVRQAGHEIAGVAYERAGAIAVLNAGDVELALVDLALADGVSGFDVAAAAVREGVPFLLMTASLSLLFEGAAGAVGVISKPYDDATVMAALSFLESALAGRRVTRPPSGLVMSLEWIERLGLQGRCGSGQHDAATSFPRIVARQSGPLPASRAVENSW